MCASTTDAADAPWASQTDGHALQGAAHLAGTLHVDVQYAALAVGGDLAHGCDASAVDVAVHMCVL